MEITQRDPFFLARTAVLRQPPLVALRRVGPSPRHGPSTDRPGPPPQRRRPRPVPRCRQAPRTPEAQSARRGRGRRRGNVPRKPGRRLGASGLFVRRSAASSSLDPSPWRMPSELAATHSAHVSGWRGAVPDLQEDASTRKEAGVPRTAGTRRCPARQRPKGWTVNEIPSTLGSLPTVGSRSYGPY